MTTTASNKNNSGNKTAQLPSSSFWDGLGGIIKGSFFEVSPLVDTEKPPGATSLWIQQGTKEQQSVSNSLWKILTLQAFMFSPNLVWVIMAAVVYMLFPYNLHEEQGYGRIVVERLVVNLNVCLSYIGFWHFAVYFCNVSHRPFVPNRQYNIDKVCTIISKKQNPMQRILRGGHYCRITVSHSSLFVLSVTVLRAYSYLL